ncbi:NADP-dependent oxidoreductase [Candidatus Daviesbacteria bacterium]|nr:NADP-dependent oxidoreductase [Candidatus Daviesbacteria bacterium]
MKAAQIQSYGGSEVIEINSDTSKPEIKNEQILVEVDSASLNPIDYKVRLGYLKEMVPLNFPSTLGGDFAGVIQEVAPDVTDFKTGDLVFGQAIVLNGGSGSLAEFAAANIKNIALKPQTLDFIQAAGLPLVGTSALQAIEEHLKVSKDQKILIHGGAGGIGSIAIQLAKMQGAYVITTVSKDQIDFVKQLGADEIIDYKSQDFSEIVKDLDGVFDTVGGDVANKSLDVLKKGGIFVSMVAQIPPEQALQKGVTAISQNTSTTSKKLERLAELIDSGKIKVLIDKVFSLEQVKEAFDYLEHSHPKGKVVVKIKSEHSRDSSTDSQ